MGDVSMKYIGIVDGKRQFQMLKATVDKSGRYLDTPFIPQYISAMYKYGIVVITILATVMIIVAGLLWTISGGNTEQISKAKTMIARAITGLIIAVSSYTILYAINPQLVEFQNLRIQRVGNITEYSPISGEITNTREDIQNPPWDKDTFDCNKRNSYAPSGVISKTQLVKVNCAVGVKGNNILVKKEMASALCKVGEILNNKGYAIHVGESYRSFETQVQYWCNSKIKDTTTRAKFIAIPGKSNHGRGDAVDVRLIDKNGKTLLLNKNGQDIFNNGNQGKEQCEVDLKYIKILAEAFYEADPKFNRVMSEIWHFEYGTSRYVDKSTGLPPDACK